MTRSFSAISSTIASRPSPSESPTGARRPRPLPGRLRMDPALHPAPLSGNEMTWDATINAAVQAYLNAQYGRAESLLVAALETAKVFGPSDPRMSTLLRTLGIVHEAMGQYPEAERLFRQALEILEQAKTRDSLEGAAALANLAGIWFILGRYYQAERTAVMAQAVYEQMNGEREINYAKALDVFADAAMLRGLYSLARLYVERGTAVRQKTVGQTHLTMAQSYSRTAELLILEDHLAEAEP